MYRILVLCHPPLLTEPPPSGFSLPVLLWTPIMALSACATSLSTLGLARAISRCVPQTAMSSRLPGVRQKRQICPASPGQVWTCLLGSAGLGQAGSQGSEGCPRELLLSWDKAAGRWAGVSLPHPPTRTQLTLPERPYPAPFFRVAVSGRSLRVGGCAEEIVGKEAVGTSWGQSDPASLYLLGETIHR